MLTNQDINKVLSDIGSEMADEQDWSRMALACADQAGLDRETLLKVRQLLGVKSNCPYCTKETPWQKADHKWWHAGGVLCQDPEAI